MKIIEEAVFEEVLEAFYGDNPVSPHHKSRQWAIDNLQRADEQYQGDWTHVLLSGTEASAVMLPWNRKENDVVDFIPRTGLSVGVVVERIQAEAKF